MSVPLRHAIASLLLLTVLRPLVWLGDRLGAAVDAEIEREERR